MMLVLLHPLRPRPQLAALPLEELSWMKGSIARTHSVSGAQHAASVPVRKGCVRAMRCPTNHSLLLRRRSPADSLAAQLPAREGGVHQCTVRHATVGARTVAGVCADTSQRHLARCSHHCEESPDARPEWRFGFKLQLILIN
jgi:hypothetical protein